MNFLLQHTAVRFFVEGLWRDEAFSWAMASRGLDAVALTARDFNPPLYYLLLYGWMALVGSSEAALRSLSAIFFAATLWVGWRFMRDVLGIPPRRATLYLGLLALNPMLAYYAAEARMYSMVAFLATASFYAFYTKRWLLYVVTTTAGLYTHYFVIFVVAAQMLALLAEHRTWRGVVRRAVLVSLPVILLAPWLLASLRARGDVAFWVDPPGWRFAVHLVTSMYTGHDPTYGFLDRPERWIFAAILLPAVALGLQAVRRTQGARLPAAVGVALWTLLPPLVVFAASLVKPVFVPRYLIFSTVGLLLLLTLGLERARPLVRHVMFVLLCGLALGYQVAQAHRHTKGEYRETLARLAAEAGPDDPLYVGNELDFFPALYYFHGPVFVVGRTHDQIAPYVGKVLIPADSVLAATPEPATRGFLLENHQRYLALGPVMSKGVRHAAGR